MQAVEETEDAKPVRDREPFDEGHDFNSDAMELEKEEDAMREEVRAEPTKKKRKKAAAKKAEKASSSKAEGVRRDPVRRRLDFDDIQHDVSCIHLLKKINVPSYSGYSAVF